MQQPSLHKFFGGSEPPSKKAKAVTEDDKLQRDREYEVNLRDRKFLESWKVGRPWLTYDEDKKHLTCKACVKFGSKRDLNFIVGCNIFKNFVSQKSQMTPKDLLSL